MQNEITYVKTLEVTPEIVICHSRHFMKGRLSYIAKPFLFSPRFSFASFMKQNQQSSASRVLCLSAFHSSLVISQLHNLLRTFGQFTRRSGEGTQPLHPERACKCSYPFFHFLELFTSSFWFLLFGESLDMNFRSRGYLVATLHSSLFNSVERLSVGIPVHGAL